MFRLGLFVDGAFLPSFEGATQRFKALAEWMQRSGVDVTVVHCYRGWSNMQLIAQQPYRTYFLPPARYHHDLQLLLTLIKQHSIDVIVMTDYESVLKLGLAIKIAIPGIRVCFEILDVCSDYQRSMGYSADRIAQTMVDEQTAFTVADLCICFSKRDGRNVAEALLTAGLSREEVDTKVAVIPFGVEDCKDTYVGPNMDARTVVFLGNIYHVPNTRAVEMLVTRVYPSVAGTDAKIRFMVVGDVPSHLFQGYSADRFVMTGRVADLEQVFRSVTLAVAPMFYGSGVKVKVLDYIRYGLPVLCTSEALHGIVTNENEQLAFAVEDNPNNYSSRIIGLLKNPSQLEEYAQRGYALAKRHSWRAIIAQTINAYQQCVQRTVQPLGPHVLQHLGRYQGLVPYHLVDHIGQQRYAVDASELPTVVVRGGGGLLEPVAW